MKTPSATGPGTSEAITQALLVACPTVLAAIMPSSIPVILFVFFSWLLPIIVCIHLGASRDRKGLLWGFFLSWLGVLILACMRPQPRPEPQLLAKPWER